MNNLFALAGVNFQVAPEAPASVNDIEINPSRSSYTGVKNSNERISDLIARNEVFQAHKRDVVLPPTGL